MVAAWWRSTKPSVGGQQRLHSTPVAACALSKMAWAETGEEEERVSWRNDKKWAP